MTEQIRMIGARIRELRDISGITTGDLAQKLGLPEDLYVKYESGESDIPVGVLFEISEMFNVELSVLLGGDVFQ